MIIIDKLTSLRAERRRREARREKFTHKNCTLLTIHLGPAGRRPTRAYDDNDGNDDNHIDHGREDVLFSDHIMTLKRKVAEWSRGAKRLKPNDLDH